MDTETKTIFDKAAKKPSSSEVFAKPPSENDFSARDLFAGDEEFFLAIENDGKSPIVKQLTKAPDAIASGISRLFSNTMVIVVINLLAIAVFLSYLLLKPGKARFIAVPTAAASANSGFEASDQHSDAQAQPQQQPADTQANSRLTVSETTAEVLDTAISWELAEKLYTNKEYAQSYHVFEKLSDNLITNVPADDFLKDFFQLKMAMCIGHSDDQSTLSQLFTTTLQSQCPTVRALSNYHLIFAENRSNHYMLARARAYRTLALLETIEDNFSSSFEADCYFMIAEAMTKQVLMLSSSSFEDGEDSISAGKLPGQLWSDTLPIETVPQMTQSQLRVFLQTGLYELGEGAVGPRIQKRPNLGIGSQWSAVALDAPLEEMISKFASAASQNIIWHGNADEVKRRAVTMYLPQSSQQLVPEVAAGSVGLIARFDGKDIVMYNPDSYTNLDQHKAILVNESIALWQRFLIRYRGDHRTANAHYAIGLLKERSDEAIGSLSEYKLVSSSYSHNPLAPFALLNSSKIKTDMHDYSGARADLDELLIQYPDCKVADQASLYLAEATLQDQLYESAIKRFKKVYNMDINPTSRRSSAFGLGKCFFEISDYSQARKWLTHAIRITENPADYRVSPAYLMLGKVCIGLGDYKGASKAFRNAMNQSGDNTEYLAITLELIQNEVRQENYLEALDLLKSIPLTRLSQEASCEVLIVKAQVLRALDLTDTAISLLRRKVEFVADSAIRATLGFELAQCYANAGSFALARRELNENMAYLPSGDITVEANLLLAEICVELKDYIRTRTVCKQILRNTDDLQVKKRISDLLGRMYMETNEPEKAAMAYAGIYGKTRAN